MEYLDIWTFQSEEVAKKIEEMHNFNDLLFVDQSKTVCFTTDNPTVIGYDWMARKLAKYCGINDGVKPTGILPWWGWYMYHGKNQKPTTYDGPLTKGNIVLIHLRMPENWVLLSDMNLWQAPLADLPVFSGMTNTEIKELKKKLKATNGDEKEKLIESTWERVFDLQPERYPFFDMCALPYPMTQFYDVQAVFPAIRKDTVVDIDYHYKPNPTDEDITILSELMYNEELASKSPYWTE